MTRAATSKLYRSFIKGLITEAGPLTYPQDASIDELNTVLSVRGNRRRRLSLDYEPDYEQVHIASSPSTVTTSEYLWKAVDTDADINFICIQVGAIVHFFDANEQVLSSAKKSFTLDLTDYLSPTGVDADVVSGDAVDFASGKGFLFIAQIAIEPLVVEYHPATDTITVVKIRIQIRDFDGIDDGLANDEEPETLSEEHKYNLRNQGWVVTKGISVDT